ncbi:MAG: outer membrane protein assembly factor BamD [Polyangiaceae bacterium]|nr:outer membrane protein assembly factor BamD [Polyangiaceae bacterium]
MEDRSFEVEPPSFANGPAQEPDQDSPSTLGAEVARLDEARTASRAGDHGEAIRIVEDYRREFPNGALAPDAEVVALEALAKLGERAEVARRAARFLARYPNDPHAGRAKRLAGLH